LFVYSCIFTTIPAAGLSVMSLSSCWSLCYVIAQLLVSLLCHCPAAGRSVMSLSSCWSLCYVIFQLLVSLLCHCPAASLSVMSLSGCWSLCYVIVQLLVSLLCHCPAAGLSVMSLSRCWSLCYVIVQLLVSLLCHCVVGDMLADSAVGFQTSRILPFKVDPRYRRELPPDFFLDISWYQEVIQSLPGGAAYLLRRIRSTDDGVTLPWQCNSEIIWTDLGSNYFPRYLRTTRCTTENCWYGHFKCRPKAFTVNVLKRIRDSCKDGVDGQAWVYEERAVSFCCECVEY